MELIWLFGWEVCWIIVMDFFKCEAKREILVFGSGKLSGFWIMYSWYISSVLFHFPFTDL